MLAGISADYYLRLERGRDRNPSIEVLESLARALQLDEDHRVHLRALVDRAPGPHSRRAPGEQPPTGAIKLLQTLGLPAFIEDRLFGVSASNAQARAVSPRLEPGRNRLRDLLLDPGEQALHPDWRAMTECLVASLRQNLGSDVDDPHMRELVAELYRDSTWFARLWNRHEVRGQRGATVHMDHPEVGPLTLNRERLSIGGTELMLVVFHPDASSDAHKLQLLDSVLVASPPVTDDVDDLVQVGLEQKVSAVE